MNEEEVVEKVWTAEELAKLPLSKLRELKTQQNQRAKLIAELNGAPKPLV